MNIASLKIPYTLIYQFIDNKHIFNQPVVNLWHTFSIPFKYNLIYIYIDTIQYTCSIPLDNDEATLKLQFSWP